MLAIALLGPPLAWVVGMPLVGVVGDVELATRVARRPVSWPSLARRRSCSGGRASPPAAHEPGSGQCSTQPGRDRGGRSGELARLLAWVGTLIFVGALFVESYGLSVTATGLVLAVGALVYVPGNLLFRRWVDDTSTHVARRPRSRPAIVVAVLGAFRPTAWFSLGDLLGPLVSRRRPDACRERTRARPRTGAPAGCDGRAHGGAPVRLVRRRRRRRLALAAGGFGAARRRLRGAVRRRDDPASRRRRPRPS